MSAKWLDAIRWNRDGLVPAIAQEQGSNDVLMLAWMNREALQRTAESGRAVYWSRSRARLWFKGEESGHVQQVHEIRIDCDNDVVLLKVTQLGHDPSVACHTGRHACFFQRLDGRHWHSVEPVLVDPSHLYDRHPTVPAALAPSPEELAPADVARPRAAAASQDTLARLAAVIVRRRAGDPDKSYVARLAAKGTDAMLKKVGEEATELVMAAKDGDRAKIVAETADLWFHSMLVLAQVGLSPADVLAELERREGQSGLEEFALRKSERRDREGG
jgi:phosphoribosyl-ATP pyrophosphohydrolase/phosphoribosyl-AMP cyclohydrolase